MSHVAMTHVAMTTPHISLDQESYSRVSGLRVTDPDFADDLALLSDSRHSNCFMTA